MVPRYVEVQRKAVGQSIPPSRLVCLVRNASRKRKRTPHINVNIKLIHLLPVPISLPFLDHVEN